MEKNRLPQLCDDMSCTGCAACLNSCRNGALELNQNSEGFYRPVLKEELCIRCGLCENNCPVLNPLFRQSDTNVKVKAGWHKDSKVRNNSSSGGAFSALAETILDAGGIVVGASYVDNLCVKHIIIDSKINLHKIRLSKYVQSRIDSDLFVLIKKNLKNGKQVLFVGTPCQCSGLKAYLRKEYENLIVTDIICHGVPSKTMLDKYRLWLMPKYGNIFHINFRDKKRGWYLGTRSVTNIGGETKHIFGVDDIYFTCYNKNNCLQYSCYDCRFQKFPRFSDITIADFWKIGQVEPFGHKDEIMKGISMIITYNDKANNLVDSARYKMVIFDRTLEEAIRGNRAGIESSKIPITRNNFYRDLNTMKYEDFINKYANFSLKEKITQLIKQRFPYFIVKFIKLLPQK